jgi:anti-anti-sigma regulatory factor/predicted RNA-binding Zn-ribbon protein involved in translation (DUF1610 family)
MSLTWTIDDDATPQRVALAGRITEEASFPELIEALADTVHIDLAEVEQVNSCGVREWILFVRALDRSGRTVVLTRCSPVMVRQLNMISNFAAGATVRSVMLPYYCEACGAEHTTVFELTDGEIAVESPCPECGEVAEFDDLPETYLLFAEPVA